MAVALRETGASRSRASMVRRSSSACEGCSCMPSPALRTGRPVARASRYGDAGGRVAQDDALRAERAQGEAGVFQDSPFSMEEDLSLTRVVVAPRRLSGEFEGGAGAGAGFVEEQSDACGRQQRGAFGGRHRFEARGQWRGCRRSRRRERCSTVSSEPAG